MRDRPDQTKTLKSFKKPTLFLAGEKDPWYSGRLNLSPGKLNANILKFMSFPMLPHMAMFENPRRCCSKNQRLFRKI
jgi:pimeloyl-ACP methyl ester carboxylesterase